MANVLMSGRAGLNDESSGIVRRVLTAPFRVIRAVYWAMDNDAKVRSRGELNVGRVVDRRTVTETHRDAEGDPVTTRRHFLRYGFDDGGQERVREKRVPELGGLSEGDAINVYLLRSEKGLESAIDGRPRKLSSREAQIVREISANAG